MSPKIKPPAPIAYILWKFPVLSETFVLNELLGLETLGQPIEIFALERPNDPRFHDGLPRLTARVNYVPTAGDWKNILRAHQRVRRQYGKAYTATLLDVLRQGRPSLVWRFLQAGWVADRLRRLHPRHLHAHFATRATTVANLSSRIAGVPYSFTAHAMDIFKQRLDREVLKRKIAEARFVVTISDFNEDYLTGLLGGPSDKIVRINNGIDLDRFSAAPEPPPADPVTMICVARFVEKKGHGLLVDACAELRDRGVDFRLLLVGKGRLRWEIEKRIKERKLSHQIKLLGPHAQYEVVERFRQSHLYVLPCIIGSDGNKDGLPVSIVEALASGLPVVATPMTGIPEVVRDGYNGLLVESGSVGALTEALQSMVTDPLLRDRLRANARSSVASAFDEKKTTEALLELMTGGAE